MEKSRDFLTGVVFFALLGVLGFFTIVLADVKFGDLPTRTVLFSAIEGLEPGHAVRIDGVRCGRVKDVLRPSGERKIHVIMEFDEEPTLFEGATFTIESASMLGGRVMVIENPTDATVPMSPDAMPPGRVAGDPLAQAGKLLDDETIASVKRTLSNLEATSLWLKSDGALALAEIRAVIADVRSFTPSLSSDGTALLADLRSAAADISEFTPALKTEGPALLAEIRSVVADVKAFTPSLETDGKAALENIALAAAEAKMLVADLRGVTSMISPDSGIGRILVRDEPWIKLESAIASVQAAAKNVESATGRLERDDNIVGLLLTDKEMATQLKRAMKALNDFLESQREDAPLTSFAGVLLTPF